MTASPAVSDFTAGTVTEAEFKTAITNLVGYLNGLLGTDGVPATALAALSGLGSKVSTKTGAHTVLAAERGTTFFCSGTWTLSLTAAATMTSSFACIVMNTSSGTITIDPAGSELINGATTLAIPASGWALITCTGTAFHALNSYTLPTAAAGTLGGIKVGSRLSIASGVLSADLQNTGLQFLGSFSVSGGNFNCTSVITSTYDDYLIVGSNILPAVNDNVVCIRTSTNNGASYDAGASDYNSIIGGAYGTIITGTYIPCHDPTYLLDFTGGDDVINFSARLFGVNGTAQSKHIIIESSGRQKSAAANMFFANVGGRRVATSAINAIRVTGSAGALGSGSVRVYGYVKS